MSQILPFERESKFGAFSGVFVPTFLSIIGVIMYLRLGYVVGISGVLGTLLIILLATSITFATGLSLSSIVTNIRIGSGGAYSIISKMLGIEVGGSVGIPLYIAQIFSVALYLFGFAEGWQYVFPGHPIGVVVLVAFFVLFLVTAISTTIAIRLQILVFSVVVGSLVSIFFGGSDFLFEPFQVPLWGEFGVSSFWNVFALFFPAVTGLIAGIGLSGDLSDPKRQIPRGVLSSLVVTTCVYVVMTFWFAKVAPSTELASNSLLIVELSAYAPLAFLGILAATFSSALTTFVAAPRLLQSLAENSILPRSDFFVKKWRGEPLYATLFSSVVILIVVLLGNLNSIAPILTMFFLITYLMINVAVFIEQSLGLPGFRPTFKISRWVPLYGAIGSIMVMFLVHLFFGVLAVVFLFFIYIALVHKKLNQKAGDVRSGLFRSIAEWAGKKVQSLPESIEHTWKPNILLPIVDTRTLYGNFPLIRAIVYPMGAMTVLGMKVAHKKSQPKQGVSFVEGKDQVEGLDELPLIIKKFGDEGVFVSSSEITVDDYSKGIALSIESLKSQVFHPNILFLPYKSSQLSVFSLKRIFKTALSNKMGVVLFDRDEELGMGTEKEIHVWISPDVLKSDFYQNRSFDLSLLVAYKLQRNWNGRITLWMSVQSSLMNSAVSYLKKLVYEARLPSSTVISVVQGSFSKQLSAAPQGDIHVVSVTPDSLTQMRKVSQYSGKSFLFVSDSTDEDILA